MHQWQAQLLASSAMLAATACGNGSAQVVREPAVAPKSNAPLVEALPGAWFDGRGDLTVVGPGKRLRLVLSAPIAACGVEPEGGAGSASVSNGSVPFHVVSEACRDAHPTILLAEESETASPTELEHSYHEVMRCAASEFGLTEGWIPQLIATKDPCPLALGQGWRLPTLSELSGLTVDDRKAIAGALFDAEDKSASTPLLLYARSAQGELDLATLSPNASEHAPDLTSNLRQKPLFGVSLRCVSDGLPPPRATSQALPHATTCLRERRGARRRLASEANPKSAPEVQALRRWLEAVERSPENARDKQQLAALAELLAAPSLERIARLARDERAMTERYAELAESVDDESVPASERERRHAEFEHLRRRLQDQLVSVTESGGSDRTALPALLSRLSVVLEAAAQAKPPAKGRKKPALDYAPLLKSLHTLSGKPEP
jgi:hypothetical protein